MGRNGSTKGRTVYAWGAGWETRSQDLALAGSVWEGRAEGMTGRGCVRGRARGGVREPPPCRASELTWGWAGGRERDVGRRDRWGVVGRGRRRGQRPGVSASWPLACAPAVLTRVWRAGIQFYHLDNFFITMEA